MGNGCTASNSTAQALFLYCSVEPLYVGIVIRPTQSGVPNRHVVLGEHLLKVAAKLWAIVSLNHREVESPFIPGMQHYSCC